MYNLYRTITTIVAVLILLLSIPIFVVYGLSELLTRVSKTVIDTIANNKLSKYLIKKTNEFAPKPEEIDEN